MEFISLGETLDGDHGLLISISNGRQARRNRFSIEQDSARAALALAATILRAGELQVLPQDIEQGSLRVAVNRSHLSVDSQRDRHCLAREGNHSTSGSGEQAP